MGGTGRGSAEVVGRLAPSPTGALHLGNARTFMVAWLKARAAGGRVVLRIEDLDHPRDKPGAAAQAVEDLRWLGFDWDEEYVQSERREFYRAALRRLVDAGLAYPCVCSRRDVEAAQSAPHDGEQLRYPGTCRGRFATWDEAARATRSPWWWTTPRWASRKSSGAMTFCRRRRRRYCCSARSGCLRRRTATCRSWSERTDVASPSGTETRASRPFAARASPQRR